MSVRSERGSAIAIVLIAVAVVGMASIVFALLSMNRMASAVQDVAERAALAAVNISDGRQPGFPCESAGWLVRQSGFSLRTCTLTGHDARIVATAKFGRITLVGRAHAGLPSEADNLTLPK